MNFSPPPLPPSSPPPESLGERVLFARGGTECRRILDRHHAQIGTADQADGRTIVQGNRQATGQNPVGAFEPSVDRGSTAAPDGRGPARQWGPTVDRGRMA